MPKKLLIECISLARILFNSRRESAAVTWEKTREMARSRAVNCSRTIPTAETTNFTEQRLGTQRKKQHRKKFEDVNNAGDCNHVIEEEQDNQ